MLKPRVKSILLTVCLTDLFRVTAKILGAVALLITDWTEVLFLIIFGIKSMGFDCMMSLIPVFN